MMSAGDQNQNQDQDTSIAAIIAAEQEEVKEDDDDDMILEGYLPEKVQAQNMFMELLQAQPSLQVVKDAYYANPDVLLYRRGDCYLEDHRDSYPLHVACRESKDDIVAFLAQEFPRGLRIVDEHGYAPLHWAAERRSSDHANTSRLSLHTFELLMDLYPDALLCQDDENHSPLSVALLHKCHMDILKLMVDRFPPHAQEFKLLLHDRVHLMLQLPEMEQLVRILALPQLKRLELEAYHWTADAFIVCMQHLRHNTTIEYVTSLTLPMDLLHHNPQARWALQQVLQDNRTIHDLHLGICDHDYVKEDFAGPDTALLQSLQDGLRNNTTICDLKLNHIVLPNVQCLCDFMLSESAPPILHLYSIEILTTTTSSTTTTTSNISMPAHKNNRITSLDIENPLMSNPCLEYLLNQIPKLPHLERLRLNADALPFHEGRCVTQQKYPNEWHITHALVNIVRHSSPNLKHLNIRKPYRFKLGLVGKVLQSNTTLHDFWSNAKWNDKIARVYVHILKYHNATLQSLSPAFQYDAYPRLQYYLQLNQSGRAVVRNPNTTLEQLIPLLLLNNIHCHNNTNNNNNDVRKRQQRQQQQQGNDNDTDLWPLSLQFGLLRESPGLWASPHHPKSTFLSARVDGSSNSSNSTGENDDHDSTTHKRKRRSWSSSDCSLEEGDC